MPLKLFNTLTHQLEDFRPLDPAGRQVLLYSCGPTVYAFAHIGNFRSFLLSDLNQLELGTADARVALVFMEELDEVLDVLTREIREGVVEKVMLESWLDPAERSIRASRIRSDLVQFFCDSLEKEDTQQSDLPLPNEAPSSEVIEALIGVRHAAKKHKRYDLADGIREELGRWSVLLEDRPDGVRWKVQ